MSLLLGLTLLSLPPAAQAADTTRAGKPKPEARAPARPATPQLPKVEPKRGPAPKPLPLGEPRLKRRKPPV
ncbi:MAG TPA: hypothetical protein VF187_03490 [Gemmatimonadales bacterium]